MGAAQLVWWQAGGSGELDGWAFGSEPSLIGSCSFCFDVPASFGNVVSAGRSVAATLGAFLWHVR